MPSREYIKKEHQEAREDGRVLKKECEHSARSGECFLYNEMCCFEDQKECPKYFPKWR